MSTIAVAIASLGRPESLGEVLMCLKSQSRHADRIVLSVTSEADLPADFNDPDVEIIMGSKGASTQRNRALDHLGSSVDYVIFYDDDYVPSRFAIENLISFFDQNPDIVGAMGNTFKDGIGGPGYSFAKASRMVQEKDSEPAPTPEIYKDVSGLYGCNMAFRNEAIGTVRFDENLPMYSWLEDNDFSNQLLGRGRLVHTNAFWGVHCGIKKARSPGLRLGYSQIANPIYLSRKGTLPWPKALHLMSRNFLANHAKTLAPEPWVDRWGRAKGNWLAIRHIFSGKLDPTHITNL
ncbi:MAG: glycosyltransferase family 2 protein [Henriciella sp.]